MLKYPCLTAPALTVTRLFRSNFLGPLSRVSRLGFFLHKLSFQTRTITIDLYDSHPRGEKQSRSKNVQAGPFKAEPRSLQEN